MSAPTFVEGAVVGLAGSASAGALWALLHPVVPGAWLLRGLAAAVGLAYVLYLLIRSRVRAGRVAAVALWVLGTGTVAALDPPLVGHVLAQLALVWLIRSWCYYASALSALADLGLGVLSLAAAAWASSQSGSVFLAAWCLLLVQAGYAAIPARVGPAPRVADRAPEDPFERAHRAAEAAVRKLVSAP